MKRTLLFTAIASILTSGAFAVSSTVTSKDYVDNTFQTKIPAQQPGWASTVITTTNTAGTVGQRGIYDYTYDFYGDTIETEPDAANYLAGMATLNTALQYVTTTDSTGTPSGDETKALPVFTRGWIDHFDRIITTNTLDYQGTWNTGNVIPTLTAVNAGVATKQDKMTCAGWPDGVAHTDENCWLWNKN